MPELFADWDAKDTGLLASALLAILADTETTKIAIKRGQKETNPLLPKHPSNSTLNAIAILNGGLNTAIAGVLPENVRKLFLGALTGSEATLAYQTSRGAGGGGFAKNLQRPLIGAVIGALLASQLPNRDITINTALDDLKKLSVTIGMRKDF